VQLEQEQGMKKREKASSGFVRSEVQRVTDERWRGLDPEGLECQKRQRNSDLLLWAIGKH
jgi:hypothetical protein